MEMKARITFLRNIWDYSTFRPHSSNAHAQPSSGARCLMFGQTLVYFHFSCLRTAKALVRLHGCTGSPDSLVAYVISTIISWAGSKRVFCLSCLYLSYSIAKPTKWSVHPAKTPFSLGIWSVFPLHIKKHWVLSYLYGTQWRLIRLGRCPGWSESSLGAQVILSLLIFI